MRFCSCRDPNLCETCQDALWHKWGGVAECRGHYWASDIPAALRGEPWPHDSTALLAIARVKVRDLTTTPELVERLAGAVLTGAERRWRELYAKRRTGEQPPQMR